MANQAIHRGHPMFIIYGWTTFHSVDSRGTFNCYTCRSTQSYELYKSTTYFTLFFIPVLPLRTAGGALKCLGCRGWHSRTALSNPSFSTAATAVPSEATASAVSQKPTIDPAGEEALRRILISLCARTGRCNSATLQRVIQLLESSGLTAPHERVMQRELASESRNPTNLRAIAAEPFASSPPELRQHVFQAAYLLLQDGHPVTKNGRQAISELAAVLRVPAAQV